MCSVCALSAATTANLSGLQVTNRGDVGSDAMGLLPINLTHVPSSSSTNKGEQLGCGPALCIFVQPIICKPIVS
jgi:hypothetical protein